MITELPYSVVAQPTPSQGRQTPAAQLAIRQRHRMKFPQIRPAYAEWGLRCQGRLESLPFHKNEQGGMPASRLGRMVAFAYFGFSLVSAAGGLTGVVLCRRYEADVLSTGRESFGSW